MSMMKWQILGSNKNWITFKRSGIPLQKMCIPLHSYHRIGFGNRLMSKLVLNFIDSFESGNMLLFIEKKQVHLVGLINLMGT